MSKWIIDTAARTVMMMNIEASAQHRLNLLDLPNELLLIIINYLPMIDALYSLVGITQRLDQLVLNPISTNTLNITCLRPELLPDRIYSLDERALATLCRTVLPRIHHQISHLIVDQFSIESVFHATEYSALHSLSLIEIDKVDAFHLFQGKTTLVDCPRQKNETIHTRLGFFTSMSRCRWRRSSQPSPPTNHQSVHRPDLRVRRGIVDRIQLEAIPFDTPIMSTLNEASLLSRYLFMGSYGGILSTELSVYSPDRFEHLYHVVWRMCLSVRWTFSILVNSDDCGARNWMYGRLSSKSGEYHPLSKEWRHSRDMLVLSRNVCAT